MLSRHTTGLRRIQREHTTLLVRELGAPQVREFVPLNGPVSMAKERHVLPVGMLGDESRSQQEAQVE